MKPKKQNEVKYGIEITKPWSKEMYDHNDKISEVVKTNIEVALFEIFRDRDEEALRKFPNIFVHMVMAMGIRLMISIMKL